MEQIHLYGSLGHGPKARGREGGSLGEKTAIKTNEPKGPPNTYPVMPTLGLGTYRTRSRSHLESGGGSLGDEKYKAPSTVAKGQEALKCNLFLFSPFLRRKRKKKKKKAQKNGT